jgi:hypothetical protein
MKSHTTFWATPDHVDLVEHIQGLVIQIVHDMDGNDGIGMEPTKITTDWRDDGLDDEGMPDGHSGWFSLIEWPVEVQRD